MGEESAQFGDGICSLRLHPQKRQADLNEDRVDERVAVPTFGKKMAAVIDFDHGDRIEGQDVADHEVDALRHDGVERPAANLDVGALRRVRDLGQPQLCAPRDYAQLAGVGTACATADQSITLSLEALR